jgi:hypothetical protein
MSIYESRCKRHINIFLSKLKPITTSINLYKKFSNVAIPNIPRLNKYISINNAHYEIYNISDNKLIDYYIDNKSELSNEYISIIKQILIKTGLKECDIYIFNNNLKYINLKTIQRFDNNITMPPTNSKKRSRETSEENLEEIDEKFQKLCINKFNYDVTEEWISASKTRNSALKDRCLDYYNEYNITKYEDEPDKTKKRKVSYGDFTQLKFKEGIEFEHKVVKEIKQLYPKDFIEICESHQARDKKMCIKTFKAMYDGIPIIYQGVLQNPTNLTLGSCDLLIRNDYINKITNHTYTIDEVKKTIFPHNKYYIAVDIKSVTIQFNVDGLSLRKSEIKPFQYQLCVYNDALRYMQEVKTTKSFILGKAWKLEKTINKQKIVEGSKNPLDKFGITDFSGRDAEIITETDDAVRWYHKLKKSENWTHHPEPSVYEIYPNMSNYSDEGYRHIKQKCAEEIKDITLISYLTPEHREQCFKYGIKSWDDDRLNSEFLGLGKKQSRIVDAILNANRDKSDKIIFKGEITFPLIEESDLTYYIDFENMIHDHHNYIYMIGLSHVSKKNGYEHKCFTLKEFNSDSEESMYNDLLKHIEITNKKYIKDGKDPQYVHYSPVECTQLSKLISNLKLPKNNIKWYDLLSYFRENAVGVKSAFNYSLKSIGKALYKNKMITTYWDESILGDNKISIIAYNKYIKKDKFSEEEFKKLIEYNHIDCKIMYDIIEVLRKN